MGGEHRKGRHWPWVAALLVLGALAGGLTYMYWPTGPVRIIVSRETTYILGPLNPDGTVNYVQYLDDKYAEGVTPANNAAPLLLRAFGPDMLPDEIQDETLRRLGLPADIFDADKHFITWGNRARPGKADANDTDPSEPDDEVYLDDVQEMLLAGQVYPDLEAWLARNAGPLELIRQAAARDKLYFPLIATSTPQNVIELLVPKWGEYRQAVKALAMRGLLKAARSDMEGSWDDVLAATGLARLLDRSPFLFGRMIGFGADQDAARAGIAIAARYPMEPAVGRRILSRLRAVAPGGDIVDLIDDGERCAGLDAVMMLSRARGGGSGIPGTSVPTYPDVDWNQVLRHVTAWHDRMVKALRLPRLDGWEEAQQAYEKKLLAQLENAQPRAFRKLCLRYGGRLFRAARTELVADALLAILSQSHGYCVRFEDQAKMTYEIETLAVALACFHAENGRWPAELKELCPSLLPSIPADRFSRDGLVYRPSEKGYLLYSVGVNLRDEGGQCDPWNSDTPSSKRKDDIAAEVKPKP